MYFGSNRDTAEELAEFIRSLSIREAAWLLDLVTDDYKISLSEAKLLIAECRGKFKNRYQTESSHVEDISSTDTTTETEENVGFADAEQQVDLIVSRMTTDPTYAKGVQESALLADFLKRPVKILAQNWTVGAVTPFLTVINPWQLFLNDPRVKNKLETFKLLHGTLHLKIMVNGSPFHFGRVFIGVRPTRFDNNTSSVDMTSFQTQLTYLDNYTAAARLLRSGLTLYTSRPHVFVDPCTNQPQYIHWPFFAATSWIDLINPDTIDRMGRLEIFELNQLKHANGADDPVTISIFAWMDDVTLTGLTKFAPVIESNVKDEYKKSGAISTVASAVAAASGYFTEIPYIGKFAMATRMGAGAVADIARLFGFSRPAIVNDVTIMRPQTFSNFANTVGGDSVFKLSLDPKQELTIDPSTVGLSNEDQMSIGYIAKKEAWIDVVPWAQDVAAGTKLYTLRVHPMVAPIEDRGDLALHRYWQTPLSFATRPFQYWSGSLKYRFQIVCSNLHRGRLLFQYDPHGEATPFTADFNNRYSQVIDISELRDFTLEVKWSQPQAYCSTLLSQALNWSTIGAVGTNPHDAATNGTIFIYVLNELASPLTPDGVNTTIEINVYISAGDDYEVRAPDENFGKWSYARQDTTVGPPVTTESNITEKENEPAQSSAMVINGMHTMCDPNCSMVYFGESVVSIRSLMKRYVFHRILTKQSGSTVASTIILNNFKLFNVPVGPGPTYGSSVAAQLAATWDYNVCALTYVRYFMQSYIGWRGGLRYKILYQSNQGTWSNVYAVRRSARMVSESVATTTAIRGSTATDLTAARIYLDPDVPCYDSPAGYVVNSTHVNAGLEIELPFYSPYRYAETNEPVLASTDTYQVLYNNGSHGISWLGTVNQTANVQNYLEVYSSIGEDFSLFFFIGASPILLSDARTAVAP